MPTHFVVLEMDQVMSVDVAAGLKQAAIIVRLLSVPLFTATVAARISTH